MNKTVLIIFLGNINYDSRAANFYHSLSQLRFNVNVISFDWLKRENLNQNKNFKIYPLKKGKFNFIFYLKFFFIATRELLRFNPHFIFAEDLYSLPISIIFGKLKKSKIIYDSREIYSHIGGLSKKKLLQNLLSTIEKIFISKVNVVVTTGDLDAEYIRNEYKIKNVLVIRNLPLYKTPQNPINYNQMLNLQSKKILIYQGVILHGRGLKIIFEIMKNLPDYVLVILGDGDHLEYYKNLSMELRIEKQVFFLGRIPQKNLIDYTAGADLGLALIENISLSYYYALPNKLFEYIMAGVPSLVSNLPQMKEIIEKYNVGKVVEIEDYQNIINVIKEITENPDIKFSLKNNCLKAAFELNWEKEFKKLESYLI
ncbi:MAG: glycosyltransferase family 4 protein [Ignavibacterium sp.]